MPSQTLKHCKIQSRKDAPKMAILEAPCAQNAHGRIGIPVSPYRIQIPPRPENPRKLLKNYNLAHPGPVPKITEKLLRSVIFY